MKIEIIDEWECRGCTDRFDEEEDALMCCTPGVEFVTTFVCRDCRKAFDEEGDAVDCCEG